MEEMDLTAAAPRPARQPRRRGADVTRAPATARRRVVAYVERKLRIDDDVDQLARVHLAHAPRQTSYAALVNEALRRWLAVHGRGVRQLRNIDRLAESLAGDDAAA
jgi:hypothetical protein